MLSVNSVPAIYSLTLHSICDPMKPTHRWLVELTHTPTTSGHEDLVIEWVKAWVNRRPDIRLRQDAAGNLLLTVRGGKRHDPVIATAHMDHPGWVVESIEGTAVTARFMGGVRSDYFPGAPIVFFSQAGTEVAGAVVSLADSVGQIKLATRSSELQRGDIGRWRFNKRSLGIRGDMLFAPACDDLAGVAAALAALDKARKKPELAHFGVLLTRAEEEGLLGAIAACELSTIPVGTRLLSIETSRSFPDSPIGDGPIIRVGDKSSVFDAELSNGVTSAVRAAGLRHQRKLMAGGSCEATAFGAYGYRSTGLCLALGNYHNQGDLAGVEAGTSEANVAPEQISLDDFDGLVALMLCVTRDLDSVSNTIRDRLASNYQARASLLGM